MLLARDGAGMIEIQLRLQKSLLALARVGDNAYRRAALRQAQSAQERAEAALTHPADLERLQSAIARNQPPIG
ncbi:hypothetical protein [Castellaniella sp. GW247-6E4]|uniref:hypothetical protein n=1 Tax=Castellaniella sp. GW247-6E4 TaxID=3140380 RepID=UPI00331583EB